MAQEVPAGSRLVAFGVITADEDGMLTVDQVETPPAQIARGRWFIRVADCDTRAIGDRVQVLYTKMGASGAWNTARKVVEQVTEPPSTGDDRTAARRRRQVQVAADMFVDGLVRMDEVQRGMWCAYLLEALSNDLGAAELFRLRDLIDNWQSAGGRW